MFLIYICMYLMFNHGTVHLNMCSGLQVQRGKFDCEIFKKATLLEDLVVSGRNLSRLPLVALLESKR